MKKDYQKPSLKTVHINIQHHLLDVSGEIGGEATKPAKGRRNTVWDDEDWDDVDWDDND